MRKPEVTYLLGVDIGTSGIKVGLFDLEGRSIHQGSAAYATESPHPGWAEQDPRAWWSACQSLISETTSGIPSELIQGICIVGLSPSLVCVNADGEVVRSAPIWSDNRAAEESSEISERVGPGGAFSLLPYMLWLKRHEPRNYSRTRYALDSFAYLNYKLTGRPNRVRAAFELPSREHIGGLGLNPDLLPNRVYNTGALIGPVLPNIAAELGLAPGTPVIAGAVDAFAGWIGTGTVTKGTLCNTVGTSDGVAVVCDRQLLDGLGRVHSVPHITGTDWIVGGAMSSGGMMLDWFVRNFYGPDANAYEAALSETRSVPPGACGLVALPYLAGERSPITDPNARAVFFGISSRHSRAHFTRAVMESVAFAVRDVADVIVELGAQVHEIRLAGGGARNQLWNQIKADVLGRQVLAPEVLDSSLLGAAIIAASGTGKCANLISAAKSMVKFKATFGPNPDNHEIYNRLFDLYKNLYGQLKIQFAELSEITKQLPH
ncbi:MAG TPA: FGGY-family carbohydrate kinase [Blastocatellia bacterium]